MTELFSILNIQDTILGVMTTIKIAMGTFPNGETYFEIGQLAGEFKTLEEYEAEVNRVKANRDMDNYTCMKPDDAELLIEAMNKLLKGLQ